MEQLPRLRGRTNYRIDYRHIIDWLVRKPGAFASYRYREHLFPSSRFRMAYDLLRATMRGHCDRRYLQILELDLQILELAAKQGESLVEDALRLLLASDRGQQTIADQDAFVQFLKRCEQAPESPGLAMATRARRLSLVPLNASLSSTIRRRLDGGYG